MKYVRLRLDDPQLNTLVILRVVANTQEPNKGITAEEMRSRIRLLDALDQANGKEPSPTYLRFEDSDFNLLQKLMKTTQFAIVDRRIVEVADDVAGALSVLPDSEAA
jgi:hypothetical protein